GDERTSVSISFTLITLLVSAALVALDAVAVAGADERRLGQALPRCPSGGHRALPGPWTTCPSAATRIVAYRLDGTNQVARRLVTRLLSTHDITRRAESPAAHPKEENEMSTDSMTDLADPAVPIRAHSRVVKHLGHWTCARLFDVRASRGAVVLDLRSPQ